MSDFYYVTKHALTRGVYREELRVSRDGGRTKSPHVVYFDIGTEAFLTWAEALADCEARLARKRLSLSRQLDRLDAMTFKKPKGGPE